MEFRGTDVDSDAPMWVFLVPLTAAMLFIGYLGASSLIDTYHLQTRGVSATAQVTRTPLKKVDTRVEAWFGTADGQLGYDYLHGVGRLSAAILWLIAWLIVVELRRRAD